MLRHRILVVLTILIIAVLYLLRRDKSELPASVPEEPSRDFRRQNLYSKSDETIRETEKGLPTYLRDRMELYVKNLEIVRKALIPPPSPGNLKKKRKKKNKYFSQLGQDEWVSKNIYPEKYNGRFIEAGALDGLTISNTRHFEVYYNWTGILIEPDPANFEELKKAGRNAWLLNGCIGSDPLQIQELKLSPGNAGAFVVSLRGTFDKEANIDPDSLVTVKCYPLNLILDAIGWTSVDYWSLDVEGAEPAILQAVDFDRFRFGLIDIECAGCGDYLNPRMPMFESPQMQMRFFTKHFMSLKGYKEVGIVHHDLMYRPVIDV